MPKLPPLHTTLQDNLAALKSKYVYYGLQYRPVADGVWLSVSRNGDSIERHLLTQDMDVILQVVEQMIDRLKELNSA
jgi:hypothetical protein